MKAKEYAAQIIQATLEIPPEVTGEDRSKREIEIVLNCVVDVANEIVARTKQVSKTEAVISAFREAVTKWKAVVRGVKDKLPGHIISDNTLGLFLAIKDAGLYEMLVAKNVFIGYEFSPSERRTLEELRENRARQTSEQDRKILTTLFMLGNQLNK